MNREKLGSRLGFIMLSAGCAIGCGNVWKFPWMCGQYGGGSFYACVHHLSYCFGNSVFDNGIFGGQSGTDKSD